jgi:hypothetical protein
MPCYRLICRLGYTIRGLKVLTLSELILN